MAQIVGELEADGLISRRPDPADGRRALLELTDQGRQVLELERRERAGWLTRAIADGLSERERQVLAEAVPLLTRLADS
jgi:DNA-binding MarR family transcriptional regulator